MARVLGSRKGQLLDHFLFNIYLADLFLIMDDAGTAYAICSP